MKECVYPSTSKTPKAEKISGALQYDDSYLSRPSKNSSIILPKVDVISQFVVFSSNIIQTILFDVANSKSPNPHL